MFVRLAFIFFQLVSRYSQNSVIRKLVEETVRDYLGDSFRVSGKHSLLVFLSQDIARVPQRGADFIVACGLSDAERLRREVIYSVLCLSLTTLHLLVY